VRNSPVADPRWRRLLASRPPRAASLLVSVFGDAVVPHGGAIWLGSLIGWLALFGINERAVRTAVHRLAADDWFTSSSAGRRADYVLTRTSRHRFADAERRIYAATAPPWNGGWAVVVLPQGAIGAAKREAARRELFWHGFGELAPAVLVHPSADLVELRLALRDLGIERRAIVLHARDADRPSRDRAALRELVASAWDLADLASAYRTYVRRFRPFTQPRAERERFSAELCFCLRVLAIHEYRRILLRDPELPAELLPEDWIGLEARAVCIALYRAVEKPAAAYVRESGATIRAPLPGPAPPYFRRFGGLRHLRRLAPAIALLLATLLGATACHWGPCPPDTELRGSQRAGQQSCEYQDSNGTVVKHGPFIEWYANGNKRSEGRYEHGKRAGRWTYWDEQGRATQRDYGAGEADGEPAP